MRLPRGVTAGVLVALGLALPALLVLSTLGRPSSGSPPTASIGVRPSWSSWATPTLSAPPGGSQRPASSSTAAPDTVAPLGIEAVRIRIDRLGIDLPIVEGDGVTAPDREAAHFPGTAWPDGGSNTYIYGHARDGLFLPLWDAQVGDEVVLTLVDGSSRCYVIDEIRPRTPWNDISVLLPTEEERLTLQTSTSYTPTAPRFVVIAHPCR